MVITNSGWGRNTSSVWVASSVCGSFGVNWKNTEQVDKSVLEDTQGEHWKIIGHKPQLSDYLAVLSNLPAGKFDYDVYFIGANVPEICVSLNGNPINFSLKTGAPATEEDALKFIQLVENT